MDSCGSGHTLALSSYHDKYFSKTQTMQPVVKAVLEGKLKGAQCSETVKSRVPTNDLYEKTKIF